MSWDLGIAWLSGPCRNGRRTSVRRGRGSVWPLGPCGPRTGRVSGMTNGRKISALAAAALLLSALTACSGDAAPPAGTDVPSQSPSSSTSTSEPSPSEADIAEAAANDAIGRYFAVVDDLRQNPDASIEQLRRVAVGGQLTAQEAFTRNQRQAGNRQVGDTTLVDAVVQQLNLDAGADGGAPTAQIDVCWDVSAVDVLDAQGRSIVTADRPERGWTRYTLTNSRGKAPFEDGWQVSNGVDLEKAPCSAA